MLEPPHRVGRVIARPFVGRPGSFTRTERRHDYAILPPEPTLLDRLQTAGVFTGGIGKIYDIYCGRGLAFHTKTKSNPDGVEKTLAALDQHREGLLFTNLVDFDMLYGHRNDVEGYARALEEADAGLARMVEKLGGEDLFIVTADHAFDRSLARVRAGAGLFARSRRRRQLGAAGVAGRHRANHRGKLRPAAF